MGFTTRLFRRGWQHPDPDKRRKAVEGLTDLDLLKKVAVEDQDAAIRRLALTRISDEAFLLARAGGDPDEAVQLAAVRNLKRPESIAQAARDGALPVPVRLVAVERCTDQAVLEPVAMQDSAKQVRMAAARKVSRQGCLEYLAAKDRSAEVREVAQARLAGQTKAYTRAITKNRSGA